MHWDKDSQVSNCQLETCGPQLLLATAANRVIARAVRCLISCFRLKAGRRTALLGLLLAGCSTAPVADLQDFFSPGRFKLHPTTPPYGGVCAPRAVGQPLGGPAPVVPGAIPVLPPPTPLGAPSPVTALGIPSLPPP